jgi:hypothetical protein
LALFGGEGVIAGNLRHEQQKLIKYNHLVANMLIQHNVDEMTCVFAELGDEGVEITPDLLAGLGPYRRHHVNRLDDYTVDVRKKVAPMNPDVQILPEGLEKAHG